LFLVSPYVSFFRRFVRKPTFCVIKSITLNYDDEEEQKDSSSGRLGFLHSLFTNVPEARLQLKARAVSIQQKNQTQNGQEEQGSVVVKEVVIPFVDGIEREVFESSLLLAGAKPLPHFPGLFAYGDQLTLRLFPTLAPSIVLLVRQNAAMQTLLETLKQQKGAELRYIGSQGKQESQLFCDFDLRFTNTLAHQAFFNEGAKAVLQGTIPTLQSQHVLSGDEDDESRTSRHDDKVGKADCFIEVRAIAKSRLFSALRPGNESISKIRAPSLIE